MSETAAILSGTQRAAIFLMSLGEQEAAEILRQMGVKEVQKLGTAMTALENVSKEQVAEVMDEFVDALEKQTSVGLGADDYLRRVLIQALGKDKADNLIGRILRGRGTTNSLETLKWMEARAITELVRHEHPQIIAIVLAHLDSDQAAEVIRELPEQIRPNVLLRIAALNEIPPAAIEELNKLMELQFSGNHGQSASTIGGVKTAASILNCLSADMEQKIMESLQKEDEGLSKKIEDAMVVFDDLVKIDDRGIQTLLRDVPNERLALALRGAENNVKEKITKNMSQRAAEVLLEDMEARGPVRLSDVEAAQKEILETVRKLAEAGTLQLSGKGGEFV